MLGKHYIALNVKDIVKSKAFYEQLGFRAADNFGSVEKKWFIMKNGDVTIGLYQDIIPKNTITFNPPNARELQKELRRKGFNFILEAKEDGFGPAHFLILDPDGNPLFFDQH
jgi:catechol 2,3-dioxygenase-like lactoylglutathione lyase family enzyme